MAAPAFVSATAHTGNPTTSATVTLPTTAADDILILVAVNAGATAAPTLTTGTFTEDANWTAIDTGTWTTGWGGVYWVRCTGNHSGQTQIVSGATDSCSALVIRVSGALTSGSPIDTNVSGASVGATNGTLAAFSTTVVDTLVCLTAATDDNQAKSGFTKNAVAMSNLSLATSTGGGDSGVGWAASSQAGTGTTGSFAITEAAGTAQGKRLSAFAIKPPAAATLERSAAVAATGAIASSATFFSILTAASAVAGTGAIASAGSIAKDRAASVAGTGAIATAGQRDLLRQSAVSATGAIQTVPQRDIQRAVGVSASTGTSASGYVIRPRSAALGATGAITTDGERDLHRSASLGATGIIATSGQVAGVTVVSRATALSATALIQTAPQRELLRAVVLAAVTAIASSGEQSAPAPSGVLDYAGGVGARDSAGSGRGPDFAASVAAAHSSSTTTGVID